MKKSRTLQTGVTMQQSDTAGRRGQRPSHEPSAFAGERRQWCLQTRAGSEQWCVRAERERESMPRIHPFNSPPEIEEPARPVREDLEDTKADDCYRGAL